MKRKTPSREIYITEKSETRLAPQWEAFSDKTLYFSIPQKQKMELSYKPM